MGGPVQGSSRALRTTRLDHQRNRKAPRSTVGASRSSPGSRRRVPLAEPSQTEGPGVIARPLHLSSAP